MAETVRSDERRTLGAQILELKVLHNPPDKVRDGMVVIADGTDWNPTGAGGGLHIYLGGWVKV